MSERITVRVVPPDGGEASLSVQDAMLQVADAFALLSASDPSVTWRLVSATTNSPFTVVAEAEESVAAAGQRATFVESMRELANGIFPEAWRRPELHVYASHFIARAATKLEKFELFDQGGGVEASLTAEAARPFVLDERVLLQDQLARTQSLKSQVGSVDGTLIGVATYYGKPSIRIRERKTGREIACVIPSYLADTVAGDASVSDVWTHSRVRVRGVISYSWGGHIQRVEAQSVQRISATAVDWRVLRDPDFTSGMTAAEYLDRFREGELG